MVRELLSGRRGAATAAVACGLALAAGGAVIVQGARSSLSKAVAS